MAQKKNSKKELERRVVKLKKKVATLTTSLNKKQSDLSRVLSSVQKKVDKLRKDNASAPALASQKKRQQELQQTTEGLLGRLRDLEQTVSIIERAGDQLRERTDALETRAAEAAHRGGEVFQGAAGTGADLQQSVGQLRDRAQAMEERLGQLSGAQEGLELQVALLSREAEEGEGAAADQGVVARSDARSQQLLSTQQTLIERVERLERSVADAQPAAAAEAAIAKLNRRAEVLESHYEALSKKEKQISALLEKLERRLKKRAPHLAEVEPEAPEGLPKTIEQQVALLSTDRVLNQARIDEVVKRAEELEKTGFSYTRHTDALIDRVNRIDQRLDALKAEERLNGLDRRGDTIEQALQKEKERLKERLDEMQRTGRLVEGRLDGVVGDLSALEERVQGLQNSGDQLDKVIEGLDGEFRDADARAKQQQELLQSHAAQLEKQREDQEDAVASNKKIGKALGTRLAALDEARQAQQDAADNLRVQQVRQEHETQNLQKQLKRRTLAGLLLLMVAAGALVYLFTRGATLPQDVHAMLQVRAEADRKATAAIADLEKDMDALRTELSGLGDSLAQVSSTVDQMGAGEMPAAAPEVGELTATVEGLRQRELEQAETQYQAQLEQRQRHAALVATQEQLQQRDAQLQQRDVELTQDQATLRADLERMAARLEELGKQSVAVSPRLEVDVRQPAKPQAVQLSALDGETAQAWAEARSAGRWTMQMAGFHRQDSLARFIRSNELGKGTLVHKTMFRDKPWYVVLYGNFDTVKQAQAVAAELPPGLAAQKPWVRAIPPTEELFRF